jgi:hypothetical protein
MAILDSEGQPVHSGPDAAINRHVGPRHIEGREFGISNIVTSVLASYGGRHDTRGEAR